MESVVNVKAPLLLMRGLYGGKLVSSAHDNIACRKAVGGRRSKPLKKRGKPLKKRGNQSMGAEHMQGTGMQGRR